MAIQKAKQDILNKKQQMLGNVNLVPSLRALPALTEFLN